jgi:hypothetical protein
MERSELLCRHSLRRPGPTLPYRLPPPFAPLIRIPCLSWHSEHHECHASGARTHAIILSFIMVLVTHDGNILVPMEEAMMQGCAICALLARAANRRASPAFGVA